MLADRVRMGSGIKEAIGFGDILEGKIRMGGLTDIDGASSTTVPSIPSDFFPLYYDGWHEFYDYEPPIDNLFPMLTIQYESLDEETNRYVSSQHAFIKYDNEGNEIAQRIFEYSPLNRNYYIAIGNPFALQVVRVRGEFILRAGGETGNIVYRQYYDVSVGSECYLTTCMVNYYGKRDDAIELTSMRKLREKYKYKHSATLAEYKRVSPHIIQGIEQSGNRGYWYNEIKKVVDKIVIWVSNEEWEKAEVAYLDLYYKLREKFYSEGD